MTRTIILLCLVLAGCASWPTPGVHRQQPKKLIQMESECIQGPFVDLRACIERQLVENYGNWRTDPDTPLVDAYFSWLTAASTRVTEGSMKEGEAKMGAVELRTRLSSMSVDVQPNQSFNYGAFLAGYALLQSSQTTNRPNTTLYTIGGKPIICNDYGQSVICN
jgi:hypothetical protein